MKGTVRMETADLSTADFFATEMMPRPDDELVRIYDALYHEPTQRIGPPDGNIGFTYTLNYARLLLRRDRSGDRARAEIVLDSFLGLQFVEPAWRAGHLPIRPNSMAGGDLNANVFLVPILSGIYEEGLGKLSAKMQRRYRKRFSLAVEFLERRWDEEIFVVHRDHKLYTNIFVGWIEGLLLAGLALDDERLIRKAEGQWHRWFNHIAYTGIDEYLSPRYYEIGLASLLNIFERSRSPSMRREAQMVLDHYVIAQHAAHHPVLEMPVCGASRDYRAYFGPGGGKVAFVGQPALRSYAPPEGVLEEYRKRAFPYELRGRATAVPYRFQSWQSETAGVGSSTGGVCFRQNVQCMVAVGEGPGERAVLTVPGEFSHTGGYVDQQGPEALCVFGREPDSYTRTQRRIPDGEVIEGTALGGRGRFSPCGIGVSDGWKETRNEPGELVLEAYGHSVHISPFVVEGDRPRPVQLEKKDVIVHDHDIQAYSFGDEPDWMGFHLALQKLKDRTDPPSFSIIREGRRTTYRCGDRFVVKLHALPTGEHRELYAEDWRTLPLFECPTQTLWPGELAARSVNEQGPQSTEGTTR